MKVSVLMSVYHEDERHLRLAIQSVLEQTHKDVELVVVDDGADGATKDVLAELAASDDRVRIIENPENRGLTASLNRGLDACTGSFIARMDGDDVSRPDRLQKQLAYLDERPAMVACGARHEAIDNEDRRIYDSPSLSPRDIRRALPFGSPLVHSSLFFRGDALRRLRYDESFRVSQDHDLLLRLLDEGDVGMVDEVLLAYRVNPSGISYERQREQLAASSRACWRRFRFSLRPRMLVAAVAWRLASWTPAPLWSRLRQFLVDRRDERRHVLITLDQSRIGGPVSFAKNLTRGLERRGVPVATSVRCGLGDVAYLVIIQDRPWRLLAARLKGWTIVQRLDGLFYEHGLKGRLLNWWIRFIRERFADYVIYQSAYAKRQAELIIGPTTKPWTTILNGADEELFAIEHKPQDEPVFITTGNFRHEGMIRPIVEALDLLAADGASFRLRVVGHVPEEFQHHLDRDWIDYYSAVPLEELPHHLSGASAFIYTQRNPPCPNSVIEALVAGLPVVGYDSGSMREIVQDAGVLAKAPRRVLHTYADFDPRALKEAVYALLNDYERFRAAAKASRERLSAERMVESYREALAPKNS